MNIKQTIRIIGAFLALGTSALAQNAIPKFTSQSFLNGLGNVILSNNVTYTFTTTNVNYITAQAQQALSWSNYSVIYTNAYLGNSTYVTTTNSFIYPSAFADVQAFSDANGDVSSNACIMIALNSTNLFLPPIVNNLPNPSNPNTVTNWVPAVIPGARSTNTITVTIQRSCDEFGNQYKAIGGATPDTFGTGTQDKFTFSFAATGVTPLVISTNLPASFMQGAKWFRASVTSSDGGVATSTCIINRMVLGGYVP